MNKIEATLKIMENEGLIPSSGVFEITEELLKSYTDVYSRGSKGTAKFDYSYARKLAGLNLMNCNVSRGATKTKISAGLVYVISNPAWPNKLKIGMTIDLPNRLSSYQVYDPYQLYKVDHYEFVLDRRKVERNLLYTFQVDMDKGEWVTSENAHSIIECVRTNRFVKDS